MLRVTLCALSAFAFACASTSSIQIEQAAHASFAKAQTFGFDTQPSPSDPAFGGAERGAAEAAIGAAFASKGLEASDAVDADILVTVRTALESSGSVPIPSGESDLIATRDASPAPTAIADARLISIVVHSRGSESPVWTATTHIQGDTLNLSELRRQVAAATRRFPVE